MPAEAVRSLRRRAEARVVDMSPAERAALTPETAERLIHELRVHQIELELQNEELRHIQEALELARARYFDLYDLAPVGYMTLSKRGLIEEANRAVAGLLGIPRNQLIGQRLTLFIVPEDQDLHDQAQRRLWSTGERQEYELRLRRMDGEIRWVQLQISRAPASPEAPPQWWIILTDVTAHRQIGGCPGLSGVTGRRTHG